MDTTPTGLVQTRSSPLDGPRRGLYSPAERARRDASRWTLVQGVLAPIQFLVFLVSLGLIARFLITGEGQLAAAVSVVVKTLTLYTIMITGAIWEKVVFGQYLFHDSFFWEDVFSMLVIVLHSLYVFGLFTGIGDEGVLFATALAAYVAYVINAGQFVWKLRQARLSAPAAQPAAATESDADVSEPLVAQAA